MRWLLLLGLCGVAGAEPAWSPRAHMVRTGRLPASSVGDGGSDGRGRFTIRAPSPFAALRLMALGATQVSSSIFTLRASGAELARLAAEPALDGARIEERRRLAPLLDKAAAAVGAAEARATYGADGRGALVAVVDTGIDTTHADFRDAAGKTRIVALLDVSQLADNLHPELPTTAGRVRVAADIDAAIAAGPVVEQDFNGHGTHVTGIAAGNGLATGNGLAAGRYVGMAPAAGIVAVKATRGTNTFLDADVLAGCSFAVEAATFFARPVVVNLSIGGAGGPHDGSSNLEVGLDEIFPIDAAGRVAVIAAGNDGTADDHASGYALAGEAIVPLSLAGDGTATGTASVEVWFSGTLSVTVEAPDGTRSRAVGQNDSDTGPLTSFGQASIDNGPPSTTRLQSAAITLSGIDDTHSPHGDWKLILDGESPRWDAYLVEAATKTVFTDHVSADGHLALPATAHNAIIVGSSNSRGGWLTADGRQIAFPVVIGAVSDFSSAGPTVDGRFAPDVIAPGQYVLSSLSVDAPSTSPRSAFYVQNDAGLAIADDGVHAALRGTSQSTPIVAGIAALVLSVDGSRSAGDVRELIRAGSRPLDGEPGFSPKSGFGLLAAGDVLALTRSVIAGAVDATRSSIGVNRDAVPPGDADVHVSIVPRDATGMPVGPNHAVAVTTTLGTIDPILDTGAGRYDAVVHLDGTRGTSAHITATVDGTALTAAVDIWLVDDRSEIGHPFYASGGCSTTPRSGATWLVFLAAAAVAIFLLRRR